MPGSARKTLLRRRLCFGALPITLAGCLTLGSAPSESSSEDTAQDTYQVSGKQTASTCGTGSLGLQASWEFDVVLKAADNGERISWDVGNGPKEGTLSKEGAFTIVSSFVVDMRENAGADGENSFLPPCSVKRSDRVDGRLSAPSSDSSLGDFTASMTFRFELMPDSDCSDLLVGEDRLAAALPCVAKYDLSGAPAETGKNNEQE